MWEVGEEGEEGGEGAQSEIRVQVDHVNKVSLNTVKIMHLVSN